MKKEGLILFDMDGTLVDSSMAMTNSVNFVRNTLDLPPIEKKMLEFYINEPDLHLPKLFYNTDEYDPAHRALFFDHYVSRESISTMQLYPNVREILKKLSNTTHLAIATNAQDVIAKNMLEVLDIMEYFDVVVGANTFGAPKPNPLMVHSVMKSFDATSSKTIFVGDSIKDEGVALNAKIDFVFVEWGYGKSEKATIRVSSTDELLGELLRFREAF